MHCCSCPYFNLVAEYKFLLELTVRKSRQSIRMTPILEKERLEGSVSNVQGSNKHCLQPLPGRNLWPSDTSQINGEVIKTSSCESFVFTSYLWTWYHCLELQCFWKYLTVLVGEPFCNGSLIHTLLARNMQAISTASMWPPPIKSLICELVHEVTQVFCVRRAGSSINVQIMLSDSLRIIKGMVFLWIQKNKNKQKKGATWLHGMNNSFSFPPAILPPLIFLFLLLPVGFFCWIQLSSWFTKKPYFWMNAFWKVSKVGFCFLSLSQTTYGISHLKIWLHFSACNSSVNCY